MRSHLPAVLGLAGLAHTVAAWPSAVEPVYLDARDEHAKVVSCLEEKGVAYSIEGADDFASLSKPWNLRLPYTPAVITLPKTADEVGDAVVCAAKCGLKVQPRGGGHSYASFSLGGKDGSAVVDMSDFSDISVDPDTGIAKVGAGQRLGNVALALHEAGRALPHGTCPGVGIGGHATHGGYGHSSRLWGLTLDRIVGLDVVLANGTQIFVDAESQPDLFFAMRGAADGLGIVTYFHFQTEPEPASMLLYTADLTAALTSADKAVAGFEALQDFALDPAKTNGTISFGMYSDTGGSFSFTGLCHECDAEVFKRDVLPDMLSGFEGAKNLDVKELSWIEVIETLGNGVSLEQPLRGYDNHDTFYAKSNVAHEPITTEALMAFWSYMIDHQGDGPFYTIINLVGGPDSAINAVPESETAYSDRSGLWDFQNYGFKDASQSEFNPELFDLVDGMNDVVRDAQPNVKYTSYPNHLDARYTADEAAIEYFGKDTWNRLVGIKLDVDPEVVFWNPHSLANVGVIARRALRAFRG